MARERTAKRARVAEPSASAAGPSGLLVASGQQYLNPFARLPDALVQKIFSGLDALEAYERSKLWAVDRRFRKLLSGVSWKRISFDAVSCSIEGDEERGNDEDSTEEAIQRSECFQKQLQRFSERLGSRQMLGVQRIDILSVLHLPDAMVPYGNGAASDKRKAMELAERTVICITGLLAAAATAAAPVESVALEGDWYWWTVIGRPSMSLRAAAASMLSALSPAHLKSMTVSCPSLAEAFVSFAIQGCAPSLLEFVCRSQLPKQSIARLVAAFPGLRSLQLDLVDGGALQEIAGCAQLEELRAHVASPDQRIDDALAAIAAGPSAAKLRTLSLTTASRHPLSARGLASVLSFTSLEALSASVQVDCAALLRDLGGLKRLKALTLVLDVSGASEADGAAALLRAAAAFLGSRAEQGLESCRIRVDNGSRSGPVDAAALRELFGAFPSSAPVVDFRLDRPFPAEALAALASRSGPRLRRLYLLCRITSADGDDAMRHVASFRELLALSPERHPGLSIRCDVSAPQRCVESARQILGNWFRNSKVVRLQSVSSWWQYSQLPMRFW